MISVFIKTEKGSYVNSNQIVEFTLVEDIVDVSKKPWYLGIKTKFTIKGYSAHNGVYYFGTYPKKEEAQTALNNIVEYINHATQNVDARVQVM